MTNLVQQITTVCDQMQTFLDKAIPDAKQTQQQYERANTDYLAHCALLHEMADKQAQADSSGQVSKRVAGGNYLFRYALREALRRRAVHDQLRADVATKIHMLDTKHSTLEKRAKFESSMRLFIFLCLALSDADICDQLSRLTASLGEYYERGRESCESAIQVGE